MIAPVWRGSGASDAIAGESPFGVAIATGNGLSFGCAASSCPLIAAVRGRWREHGQAASPQALDGVPAQDLLGQLDRLARVVDVELDAEAAGARAHLHLVAERGRQRVLGSAERVGEVGVDDDRVAAMEAPRRGTLRLAPPARGL